MTTPGEQDPMPPISFAETALSTDGVYVLEPPGTSPRWAHHRKDEPPSTTTTRIASKTPS